MQLFDQIFRRREDRWFENGAPGARQGRFAGVVVIGGRRVPVLGTTVSYKGLAFVSPRRVGDGDVELTFTLRSRPIPSRVHVDASDCVRAPERLVYRYFCSFVAIAADDWDAVVRYVEDAPEPKRIETTPPKRDDEFRSLPAAVQGAIVQHLVRTKRLAPPSPGTAPLIRMTAGPVRDAGQGRWARDVLIHSRITVADEPRSFDSRFRVWANERIEPLP